MYLNLQFPISEFSFTKHLPMRINKGEGTSDSASLFKTALAFMCTQPNIWCRLAHLS